MHRVIRSCVIFKQIQRVMSNRSSRPPVQVVEVNHEVRLVATCNPVDSFGLLYEILHLPPRVVFDRRYLLREALLLIFKPLRVYHPILLPPSNIEENPSIVSSPAPCARSLPINLSLVEIQHSLRFLLEAKISLRLEPLVYAEGTAHAFRSVIRENECDTLFPEDFE